MTTDLTGAGGDASEETTALELVGEHLVDAALGGTAVPLGDEALGGLDGGEAALLDVAEVDAVVALVPGTVGGGINEDDSTLDEGLGADKLVGGGVVLHINDTGLAGDGLRAPGEVSLVEAESAPLEVAAVGADGAHAAGAGDELSASSGAGKHELALELVDPTGTTSSALLLEVGASSTHYELPSVRKLYEQQKLKLNEICRSRLVAFGVPQVYLNLFIFWLSSPSTSVRY